MTLQSPFRGVVFDQMFSEAVETVTGNLLKAHPSITAGQLSDLQDAVEKVMLHCLNLVAFQALPPYGFGGKDNSLLVSRTALDSGVDLTLTETIISEAYTSAALGEIPNWYQNPADAVRQVTKVKRDWEALQPSFLQRVAGTIFSPLGISGSQAILFLEIGAALAALVAVAYVIRTFKR